MLREVVWDVETTGLSFSEDRVVEIGAVELIDLVPTGKTFHAYINPQMRMPMEAQKIHGLTTEFLKTKPTFTRVVHRFLRFIGDAPLVAHNADFDMGMLNAELRRLDMPPLDNPVVNTLKLAREVKKGGLHNLDALCRHFGIDNSKRDKHGALLDSEILAKVYMELRGGRQFGMELVTEKVSRPIEFETAAQRPRPLPSRLTEDAIKAHQAFVETLGNTSLWARYMAEPIEEITETKAA